MTDGGQEWRAQAPGIWMGLDAKEMTLDRLLELTVGDQLYEEFGGKDLCIASGISITIPDDPTGIWERIVLRKIN